MNLCVSSQTFHFPRKFGEWKQHILFDRDSFFITVCSCSILQMHWLVHTLILILSFFRRPHLILLHYHWPSELESEVGLFASIAPQSRPMTVWLITTREWQACIRRWGPPQSHMIGCWMEIRWMEHMPKEQDPNQSEGEEKRWAC